jgi:hypothetical protein
MVPGCPAAISELERAQEHSEDVNMTHQCVLCAAASLGTLVLMATAPAVGQVAEESVPLIMMKPQGASFSTSSLGKLYAALKKRAGKATNQILPLTKKGGMDGSEIKGRRR